MVTFAVGLRGQTEKPHGLGAKIVEGSITGASGETSATVNAGDIELKTIYSLCAHSGLGTEMSVHVGTFTPGAYADNYATVLAHTMGTTHRAAIGTFRIFAIGE